MLPNEEAISSLVRCVYKAITEEVPCERSRVSGGNSSNVEEEYNPLYNPRVNYGSNGSSGKKGKKDHSLLEILCGLSFADFPFEVNDLSFPSFPLLPLLL